MSRESLRQNLQELLERAAEFDAMVAMARTSSTKHSLASFAARYRTLAAWRAASGQKDEELFTTAPVEMPEHRPRSPPRRSLPSAEDRAPVGEALVMFSDR
jgi:hypothetical protein